MMKCCNKLKDWLIDNKNKFLHLTIKYNRFIDYSMWVIISIIVISSTWLTIRNNYNFTTICDYKYVRHFFNKLTLKIFLAALISLSGIVISLLVLENVRSDKISSIDDFLIHLIRFFDISSNNDEIVILTPTFFFGGTTDKNKWANHYFRVFKDKFNKFNNLTIYSQTLPEGFCKYFLDKKKLENNIKTSQTEKKIGLGHKLLDLEEKFYKSLKTNDLLKFHNILLEKRNFKADEETKYKYFKKLCDLYSNVSDIKIEPIPDSLLKTNIILFLNLTNIAGAGIIAVFDEENNYDLKGNFIESKQAIEALHTLFIKHINEIKQINKKKNE